MYIPLVSVAIDYIIIACNNFYSGVYVQEVAELKEKDILGVSSPTTGACGHSSMPFAGRNPLVSGTQHMYIALVSV